MRMSGLCLFVAIAVACGGDEAIKEPVEQATPEPTHEDEATAPQEFSTAAPVPSAVPPEAQVTVLTYNVLWGAGVDRQYDERLPESYQTRFGGRSRLAELVEFIRSIDPDIVGIQEASGWGNGEPSVVEQVAAQLDMNFYYAEAVAGQPLVLLSKLEIVEASTLPREFGTNGALLAELRFEDGSSLHTFVVHLNPVSAQTAACQVRELHAMTEAIWGQKILLMGDMNVSFPTPAIQQLVRQGWMLHGDRGIDQVWSAPLENSIVTAAIEEVAIPERLSDHPPVVVALSFKDSPGANAPAFHSMSSEACEAPLTVFGPLEVADSDRVMVESIGLDENLFLAHIRSDFVFENPHPEGVTIYDYSLTPGYGGAPGRGNLTLVAPANNAFQRLGSLRSGDAVDVTYQGQTFQYHVVVVCQAPREGFLGLFFATELPILTMFSVPFDNEFTYVLAELDTGSLVDVCPVGDLVP